MANNNTYNMFIDNSHKSEASKHAAKRIGEIQQEIDRLGKYGGKNKRAARADLEAEKDKIREEVREKAKSELDAWQQTANLQQLNRDKQKKKDAAATNYNLERWKANAARMSTHELELFASGYSEGQDIDHDYDKLNIYAAELRRRGKEKPADKMSAAMEKYDAHFDWLHTTQEGKEAKRQMNFLQETAKDGNPRVWYSEGENDPEAPVGFRFDDLLDTSPLERLPEN